MDLKQALRMGLALAHEVRWAIVEAILHEEGSLYVFAIRDYVNAQLKRHLEQPTISHHIRILVSANLLYPVKDGLYAYYQVDEKVLEEYLLFLLEEMVFCHVSSRLKEKLISYVLERTQKKIER